jgi:hypothetical protein
LVVDGYCHVSPTVERVGQVVSTVVVRRGFVAEVWCGLETLLGGVCMSCERDGLYSDCPMCRGTGRTEGVAKELFAAHPITAVVLTDRGPDDTEGEYQWVGSSFGTDGWRWDIHRECIPWEVFTLLTGFHRERLESMSLTAGRYYPTAVAAADALSRAAVAVGRELAKLPPLVPS